MVISLCWHTISCGPREPVREQLDRGEIEPSLAAGYHGLEVLGEAAVAVEPGEGSFDHPSTRQDVEAGGAIAAFDDVDAPLPVSREFRGELVAGITAIGKDMTQPGEQGADRAEQRRRAVTILDVAGVSLRRPPGVR